MIETQEKKERLILVGVCLGADEAGEAETEACLDELEQLVDTAGAVTVGRLTQKREGTHPGTYIGTGKIEELRLMAQTLNADGIVCDDELKPAQLANLCDALGGLKVMDRTLLILDIFAARASTSEGKIQVELAQLKYRATRLTGLGKSLSRLGGGIGTRGPGEKKLEIDRRRIHERIGNLKADLEGVQNRREQTRAKRKKSGTPVAAIVGYTNAGKSTLLSTLTGADTFCEDKLFATLDPLTRNLVLPSGQEVLLTDTVGFINKLPHNLIEAFKSTLEEAVYADIILHVVDMADPHMDVHMQVVYDTLRELGMKDKPIITVFNKCDLVAQTDQTIRPRDLQAVASLEASAATGKGMEEICTALEDVLRAGKIFVSLVMDYKDVGKIQVLREKGQLTKEEYIPEGIAVEGWIPMEFYHELK